MPMPTDRFKGFRQKGVSTVLLAREPGSNRDPRLISTFLPTGTWVGS